jgi:cell division protein FtsW
LALVYVPGLGVEVNGARRWVQFGPASWGLRFQPSELLKVALPIFLAYWLARGVADRSSGGKDGAIVEEGISIRLFCRGFLPVVAVVGLCVALVGLEDFGTAVLLAAVTGAILLVSGARWLHLLVPTVPAILAFVYLLFTKPHRLDRIYTFLDIWKDPEGSGYQAIQSLCTIASGGWWGRGLGQGFGKGYLPEARNDFIFAVICEELGMVGAAAVIVLLMVLMWKSMGIVNRCLDPAGKLLAFGIAMMIGLQAAMNIAVVTVSVPTKGISLPLVSAGGSGAIFLGALVGILACIARSKPPAESMVEAAGPGAGIKDE